MVAAAVQSVVAVGGLGDGNSVAVAVVGGVYGSHWS